MLLQTRLGRLLALAAGLGFLAVVIASYAGEGILWSLLQDEDPRGLVESIKAYFARFGVFAPFVYMAAVTVEVVLAPIPGTALYLPGGVIFGWFVGGTMALLGNVFGAGIACTLSRVAVTGVKATNSPRVRKLKQSIEKRGVLVVFLLRLNPLTSSDLVSYAAGTTSMATSKVMLGTFLGMLPLCYAQAYFADELVNVFPRLVYALIPLSIGYAAVALFLIVRARRCSKL